MRGKSDARLRADYADLLEDAAPEDLDLVRALDVGYTIATPPRHLYAAPAFRRLPDVERRPARPSPLRFLTVLVALVAIGVLSSTAGARPDIQYLGRFAPAAAPSFAPTDTFRPVSVASYGIGLQTPGCRRGDSKRVPAPAGASLRPPSANYLLKTNCILHLNGKPEVLVIALSYDPNSQMMGWPLVKALTRFGTFENLAPAKQICGKPGPQGQIYCSIPAFDLAHARYRSPYLALAYRQIEGNNLQPRFSVLRPAERRLYDRYVRAPGYATDNARSIWETEGGGTPGGADRFPAIALGRYLALGTAVMISGDFEPPVSFTPPSRPMAYSTPPPPRTYTFQTTQRILAAGDSRANPLLIQDVNIDANIITAAACSADGNRPAAVCTLPTIRSIEHALHHQPLRHPTRATRHT